MRPIISLLLASLVSTCAVAPVSAKFSGDISKIPPDVQAWFKAARSQTGVPCCDVSDGYRSPYRTVGNKYQVLVEGTWLDVPPSAYTQDMRNPIPKMCIEAPELCAEDEGDAVVWYVRNSPGPEGIYIRCFTPGSGG